MAGKAKLGEQEVIPRDVSTESPRPTPSSSDVHHRHGSAPDADASPPVIVGIGASAGGIEALQGFFSGLPTQSSLICVVVVHRSSRKSFLPEVLSRYAKQKVVEVTDGMTAQEGTVYVAPAEGSLTTLGTTFHILESDSSIVPHLPIDAFFRDLAENESVRAVGIVLSGTGSDGTLGLQAIRDGFGLTLVQSPETAKYDNMPRSAIRANAADFVMPPGEMAATVLEAVLVLKVNPWARS